MKSLELFKTDSNILNDCLKIEEPDPYISSHFYSMFPDPTDILNLKIEDNSYFQETREFQLESPRSNRKDQSETTTLGSDQISRDSAPSKEKTKKKRKKRLYGKELLRFLRENRVYASHTELFDPSLTDTKRKKLMQKIRNRISAQESRDRKKNIMLRLKRSNSVLHKENQRLEATVEILTIENTNLKNQLKLCSSPLLPTGPTHQNNLLDLSNTSEQDISGFGDFGVLSRNRSPSPSPNWKTFSIFLIGILAIAMTIQSPVPAPQVKTGGIIPLFGKQLISSTTTSNHIVLAENICSKYPGQAHLPGYARGIEISRRIHGKADNIYLGKGYGLGKAYVIDEKDYNDLPDVINGGEMVHDTIYCNEAIHVNGDVIGDYGETVGRKKWLNILIPTKREGNMQGEEYIGVYAQVLGRRKIRVVGGEMV